MQRCVRDTLRVNVNNHQPFSSQQRGLSSCEACNPSRTETTPKTCPQCGQILQVLLFLGITPDGYVCEACHMYFSEDLKPLAHIIV